MRVGRSRVVSRGEKKCNNLCAFVLLCILAVGFFVYSAYYVIWAEIERYEKVVAFTEAQSQVIVLENDHTTDPENVGKLVHFQSNQVIPKQLLEDVDFGVAFPQAVKVQRTVEYCQWQEYFTDRTETDDNGNEETIRTYYYVKGWVSRPIPSIFFDQPFGHDNPQRDPLPAQTWRVNRAKAGAFELTEPFIDKMNWFSTANFDRASLHNFQQSLAYREHGFNYVGDGYFYSAYQERGLRMAVKLFGQWLDGTLLDFQIGDLFSVCTPGDIRVQYSVVASPLGESGVSVVGKLDIDDSTHNNNLIITEMESSRQYKVGLIHRGFHAPDDMFRKDIADHNWKLLFSRVLLFLCCFEVLAFIDYYCMPTITGLRISKRTSFGQLALRSLFLAGALVSILWNFVWGPRVLYHAIGAFSGLMLALCYKNYHNNHNNSTTAAATGTTTASVPPSPPPPTSSSSQRKRD
eukprot:GEZU01026512.1.p1 GENE.GEZU01026512.1~~GEZU01026512.1.p1  ORF type:complete len:462 (-),score=116.73 GEZU01026512.1:945-2330(-)